MTIALTLLLAGCGEISNADPVISNEMQEDQAQDKPDTSAEPVNSDEPNGPYESVLPQEQPSSRESKATDTSAPSQENRERQETDDYSDDDWPPVTDRTYPQDLTEALAWEQMKANYEDTFWDIRGKSLKKLVEKRYYLWYGWIPDKGEAVYFNSMWDAECVFFSGPILSEDSKCVAIAYDFKYTSPGWNGNTTFSKALVLKAGWDVKWVERKDAEAAYLEYTFDGLQTRVYTNDDGTEILSDRNVLLKEESAEEMFGLRDLYIDEGFIVKGYNGTDENRIPLYDYIDCFGRTQEEIAEMLPGNYKFNVYGSVRELNDNIEYSFIDGFCSHVNVPVGVVFPDLGDDAGVDYIKKLGMPFTYRLASPKSTYYMIKFEKFDIFIYADSDANIVTDEKVAIQFKLTT
jgi:hypothetical protein